MSKYTLSYLMLHPLWHLITSSLDKRHALCEVMVVMLRLSVGTENRTVNQISACSNIIQQLLSDARQDNTSLYIVFV